MQNQVFHKDHGVGTKITEKNGKAKVKWQDLGAVTEVKNENLKRFITD